MPLAMEIYKRRRREGNQEMKRRERRIWTEEGKNKFQAELNKIVFNKVRINEMVEELIENINNPVLKRESKIKKMENGKFQIVELGA